MSKNGRIIPCRFPGYDETDKNGKPKYYITLPPIWTGRHADIESEAVKAAKREGLEGKRMTFAVSIALLDDYCLPGMESKQWDFNDLPISLIAWVNAAAYGGYLDAQKVEKKFLSPLESG